MTNLKYYPTIDNIKKLWSALGSLQKSNSNIQTGLDTKLTANKGAAQPNSTAVDVAGLVNDFNSLLAKLRAAGIINP